MVVQKAMIEWKVSVPAPDTALRLWNEQGVLAIRKPCHMARHRTEFLLAREDEPFVRKPRGPWQAKPMTRHLREALVDLHQAMQDIFTHLYTELGPPAYSQFTFRPTITRGEPHKDVEKGTVITAFVNLDTEDRVWRIEGEEVRFPPGCMWIFQAEKIEHQVVFGRCAAQLNWHLMKEIK